MHCERERTHKNYFWDPQSLKILPNAVKIEVCRKIHIILKFLSGMVLEWFDQWANLSLLGTLRHVERVVELCCTITVSQERVRSLSFTINHISGSYSSPQIRCQKCIWWGEPALKWPKMSFGTNGEKWQYWLYWSMADFKEKFWDRLVAPNELAISVAVFRTRISEIHWISVLKTTQIHQCACAY